MKGNLIDLHRRLARIRRTKRILQFCVLFIFTIWYYNAIPDQLFNDSTSTVILDRNGKLLGAHISADEQWRFEACDSVPYKFRTCIVAFEDRNFYNHIGVSIKGISRAIMQNISNGERVSGASTITMQLVRLMRKNPARTYREKILEMILATRIECSYSKDEILALYASHAPFGNNVVGLNAASWRFFNRPAHQLSWSESATLAVLPNAPGLIYPGRNQDRLKAKRDRLLTHLYENEIISETTYNLAVLEPLPSKPVALPQLAPHILDKAIQKGFKGRTVTTNIDSRIQSTSNRILEKHMDRLRENKIYNAAIIITEVSTGNVVGYIGNSVASGREHSSYVDCANAPRSSGSILKPFLYERAIADGTLSPNMLLMDVPSKFGSFSPKNFNAQFDGLIPANLALARSLNIPMVHLLNGYGLSKFHSDLKDIGLTSINRPASHYGLSLILGGAEVKLEDLNTAYLNLARSASNESYILPTAFDSATVNPNKVPFDALASYQTLNALLEVRRPDTDNNWRYFESSRKIAWKTGTSFGFRDAWAVGVTPDYVVSVWVGNADGEGRPGLVGIQAAAPILFDIFQRLPNHKPWFSEPLNRHQKMKICKESGYLANVNCTETVVQKLPEQAHFNKTCPYHQLIHLDQQGKKMVDASCYSPSKMVHQKWFVVPTSIEKWYRKSNPHYQPLPPRDESCQATLTRTSLIYPKQKQHIYLPFNFNEERNSVVFEAASSEENELIYWHLDDEFIGITSLIHQIELKPDYGEHVITITNASGTIISHLFTILGEEKL